jgi:GT2 family glycosyltransferase
MLDREFVGKVIWIQSPKTQGPGGGRDLLIRRAKHAVIATFDDDSWPLDSDYFAVAARLMDLHPSVGVLTGQVALRGEEMKPASNFTTEVASFECCACVFRREAFLQTRGFMPLRYGYGMEEADLGLQLLDEGWTILRTSSLRVIHDSELQHHSDHAVNAAHITNTALLAFLRYPKRYWLLGFLQVVNRVRYAVCSGRTRGIGAGLLCIPRILWGKRGLRAPVGAMALSRRRKLVGWARNRWTRSGT